MSMSSQRCRIWSGLDGRSVPRLKACFRSTDTTRTGEKESRRNESTSHHGIGHWLACREVAADRGAVPHLCAARLSGCSFQVAEYVAEFSCDNRRIGDWEGPSAAGGGSGCCCVGPYESCSYQTIG